MTLTWRRLDASRFEVGRYAIVKHYATSWRLFVWIEQRLPHGKKLIAMQVDERFLSRAEAQSFADNLERSRLGLRCE
jgi:hypothetical protein